MIMCTCLCIFIDPFKDVLFYIIYIRNNSMCFVLLHIRIDF